MTAASCARPGGPRARHRQRARRPLATAPEAPLARGAALLLALAVAAAAVALPLAQARPVGGGSTLQQWRPEAGSGGSPSRSLEAAGPGGGGGAAAAARRRLLDFRMNLGAATFTDPSSSLEEALGVGLPAPGGGSPLPVPDSVRRMAARPKDAPPPPGAASRVQLPRCYFSASMKRCFLNPYYPLAYEPPTKDSAAR
jgi:hypothetical protein